MNDIWNLDPIYRGFDDPAFQQDYDRLESTLALLKEQGREVSPESGEALHYLLEHGV